MNAQCFRFDTPRGTVLVSAVGDEVDRKRLMVWHAVGPDGETADPETSRNKFGLHIMRSIFRAVRALMPEVKSWVVNRDLRERVGRGAVKPENEIVTGGRPW